MYKLSFASVFTVLFTLMVKAQGPNTSDTRLLHDPAISDNNIAFIYAEDLWIAERDGSNPKRLTIDEGIESDPIFSPDGSMIAFSAEYDGNIDVFVVSTKGGVPKRLTWHPGWDFVRDFNPDGKGVTFISGRSSHTRRYAQLFSVSIENGTIEELKIPNVNWASYSQNEQKIAYTPLFDSFRQWKNYRGGSQSRIWIYSIDNYEVVEIPKPDSGSNDTNPDWIGDQVYFVSDRDGEFNIYSFDQESSEIKKLTNFTDFSIISMSSNGKDLIFDQAGYLHILNGETGVVKRIAVGIATDLLELRSRFVSGDNYIRSGSLSPSGARLVVDFRGDIITVPAEKGDPMNLTETTGIHEKRPQWSPDGSSIAYFSDASGEYAIHVKSVKTGNVKSHTLNGAGFYGHISWSPDSKSMMFVDNSRSIYRLDLTLGKITKIASDVVYTPGELRDMTGTWSPDSKWLTYTIWTETNFETAFVYSVENDKSYALSDGLSNVTDPTFDPSGKYIYMLASTDSGPVTNWFDQSNQDMESSNNIYLVTLRKDIKSPLAKENDTEETKDESDKSDDKKDVKVSIDWEGIENRIISLPIDAGTYSNLSSPKEGQIYYQSRKAHSRDSYVRRYDLNKRKDKEIVKADGYEISANGKKMLVRKGSKLSIMDAGSDDGKPIPTSTIKVKIDPKAEWINIFNEAWRVNRDYFYDPGMHGLDWDAMKTKYQVFLPDVSCRGDLYRMMQWMFSEVSAGHHRFGSRGDRMNNPDRVPGGLLGADFEVKSNRYQFKKIYGGLNWTPNLRSPLTEPGVNVNVGDYLLAVNGKNVTSSTNLFSFFENTTGKIVKLTVGSNANGNGSRIVEVVPIGNESALRNRDWVEGNMKKVHEATDGQVAYVYVPNTAGTGHQYFKRYFFPQANKKAIIIDERFNGGGQLADYYIDILNKPYQSSWNFRYGKDLKAPSASIQGPKVMLIDETAGSGGDYLPWMFRKFGLGKLVGKRTWGGLVGVLGYPEFIDGGVVTAPNVGFWTEEEGFGIENVGIPPDVEVEQWPKDVIAGKDPQLEKAIQIILEELKANPPKERKRPAYPVRVKD